MQRNDTIIYIHIKKSTYELQHYLYIFHRVDKRSGLTTCGGLVNVPVTLHRRASRGVINARSARAKDSIRGGEACDTIKSNRAYPTAYIRVISSHRRHARACARPAGTHARTRVRVRRWRHKVCRGTRLWDACGHVRRIGYPSYASRRTHGAYITPHA